MKKIIMLLAAVVFSTAGCEKDVLDVTPDGRITLADVFSDEKRTEAYLNTVYSSIPTYFYSYEFFSFLSGCSDEAVDGDEVRGGSKIAAGWNSGSLTPSFNPLEVKGQGSGMLRYNTYWKGIRDANVFLANIDEANVPNLSNKERFKAEAQTLRAFYYWELIKQYGPMPIVDKPFDLTFDYATLTRPSFQQNIDFIVKDCDDAIANPKLPLRITLEGERGRFSKAVAYAIKSEALLYNASPLWNPGNDVAKWQAAAEASKVALSVLTAGGEYALAENYGDYFINTSDINTSPRDRETIFERPGGQLGNNLSVVNGFPSYPGLVKVGTCPSQELVDTYDMQATGEPAITGYSDADHLLPVINVASGYDANNPYVGRDPRFYATVWYNGAQYDNIGGVIHTMETYVGGADRMRRNPANRSFTPTGYYLRKFLNPKLVAGQIEDARWKKYRLAEIYLNYAEAENEANGPTTEAHDAINVIRSRAQMPDLPTGLSKDEMRERIHRERRVELAIEEHRFWDVRRWKILDQTDKVATGMEITKNADNSFSYQRFVYSHRSAWEDKFLLFPIPIADASIVPDFEENQNPGW